MAKSRPSFVVDTHVREKNPFLETFLWHYLNLSQKHFQNSAFISRRGKARNHSDESFEFAIKFVFVDDFVRKFGFVDDLAQKKKSFLLLLLNLCFIFLLLFCFIGGLEKDWNEYNEDGSKIDREKKNWERSREILPRILKVDRIVKSFINIFIGFLICWGL